MISKDDAQNIALIFLNKGVDPNYSIVIIEEETVEYPEGYVFSGNTKQYIEGGDSGFRISGFSPIFVEKISGEVFDPYKNKYLEPQTLIRMFRKKVNQQK